MADLYQRDIVLGSLIRAVQARLGNCEPRVAASLLHLGIAARLLSPQIGCLLVGRFRLDLSVQNTRWRKTSANFLELGIGQPRAATAADDGVLIRQSMNALMTEHLLPLTMALRSRVQLANPLLLGNIASAVVGATRVLRPHLGAGWADVARQLVKYIDLSQYGDFGASEPIYVRRSCCLYYRLEAGGYCGDCPISHRRPRG